MSVTICHASIDENGKAKNGSAGDQTGKEVCTRSWYSKQWGLMLRYKSASIAKKVAKIAKKLANSNLVGYDQNQRNTLYSELKKNNFDVDAYIKSGVKTETDCSAFLYACWCCVVTEMRADGNAPITSTMKSFYTKHGFTVYEDSNYLTTDANLQIGDILVKAGSHTVMAITAGTGAGSDSSCPYSEPSTTVKQGQTGNSVKWVQWHLINLGFLSAKNSKGQTNLDGDFGSITLAAVKAFQKKYDLEIDGVVGKITRAKFKSLV